ncbi:MAG: pyridoxal phosphate-dependent class II aminotransferase [Selenomonadaceae bacterium]|nr:pyridoxal phosphate-dependent class II aminotransferase [Selenomonadaceae bacterium]
MNRFVHGGNIYEASPEGKKWLDFSANINPLGLCASVKNIISESIEEIVHYPDPSGRELKEAISVHYGVSSSEIVLGNGAAEFFYVLMHSVKPKRILIPVPSFSEYERASISTGAAVDYFQMLPEDNFRLSEEMLIKTAKEYDVVFLGNPNNPTGCLLKKEFILRLADSAPKTMIIVDESFLDFLLSDDPYSVRKMVSQQNNLVVLASLTKFYAIPGLRLGFGLMNENLVHELDMQKDPWNVNLLAHKAGIAALAASEYQEATRAFVAEEKDYLSNSLKELNIGVKIFTPTVNFILMDISGCRLKGRYGECLEAASAAAAYREKGVLVRNCDNYPMLGNTYIRIAVRTREENNKFLEITKEIFAGK